MTSSNFIENCQRIHACTEPQYGELFRLIGRQPDGVRSLVQLRADLLKFLPEMSLYKIIYLCIILIYKNNFRFT